MRTSFYAAPGRRVEAARGSDHHRAAFVREVRQHPLRELVAVIDRQARHEVEGALRLREEHARDLPQAVVEEVPPLLVLGHDAREVVGAELRSPDGHELREAGRREPPLRHAQAGLVNLAVARGEGPEADAAGAEALRQAVDHDDLLVEAGEREPALGMTSVVDELAVHLVHDEEEARGPGRTRPPGRSLPGCRPFPSGCSGCTG